MVWRKGQSGNPKGGKIGNRGGGRTASKVKKYAKRKSIAVIKRLAAIGLGLNMEQVVNENGETIKIPAPVREQIKADEIILKVARELGTDLDIETNDGSVTVRVVNYGG